MTIMLQTTPPDPAALASPPRHAGGAGQVSVGGCGRGNRRRYRQLSGKAQGRRRHVNKPSKQHHWGNISLTELKGETEYWSGTATPAASTIGPWPRSDTTRAETLDRDPEIHLGRAAWMMLRTGEGNERTRRNGEDRGPQPQPDPEFGPSR